MARQPPPQKEDTFHQARSRLVDAYARLEARLVRSLIRAERPVKGDTVASKLKTLRDAATTQSVEKTADALERLSVLVQIRADFVHGVMHLIDIDGERFATFRNAREAGNTVQKTSQISYKNLKSLSDEIDQLSAVLDQLKFNPASSPPPPSPGAASGP